MNYKNGQIFELGITGRVVCSVLQRGLRGIGVDSSSYGGHSLRAGMVTAAAENGVSELIIREVTGHKTIGILADYVRSKKAMRVNPLKGVL